MSRVKLSYRGIGAMLRSDFIEVEMLRRAALVEAQAIATAPYDASAPADEPHYKDCFHVTSDKASGYKHDRAGAHVVNDSDHAFPVEWGNKNVPRHRTMGKALDAAKG